MTRRDPAVVTDIIDADTFDVRIDLGWGVSFSCTVRVKGLDAPEADTEAGKAAQVFVNKLLAADRNRVVLVTEEGEPERSFSRYVAGVEFRDGRSLAQAVIDAGHGKVYDE